jgi:NTE family protein
LIFPKYSLLDQTVFDQALQRVYGATPIQDVWKPFFAVATDLSDSAMRVIRTGPLWQAVRASSSIPGVLPPFFYADGHMLADGAIADNVPLGTMKSLKDGPNIVVDVARPERRLFNVDYQAIPGRWGLLNRMINPFSRSELPRCPSPANVIQLSIFTRIREEPQPVGPHDLFLNPPPIPGASYMNWARHWEVFDAAYRWGVKTLGELESSGHPALVAIQNAMNGGASIVNAGRVFRKAVRIA